jgi:hypothetical protein
MLIDTPIGVKESGCRSTSAQSQRNIILKDIWYYGFKTIIRGPFPKFGDSHFYWVGTLWRCGDGLFFEVPPLASDALLITLHPLLENGVTVVLKEPFFVWRSNFSGASALRDWKVATDALTEIGGTPSEHSPYSTDLTPFDFWAFSTMKRELRS